jgi:predicted dinucleotide-binding enzyme
VQDIGLEPMDVGPLVTARYVEDMYRLYSGYRRNNPGYAFDYHLAPRPDLPTK